MLQYMPERHNSWDSRLSVSSRFKTASRLFPYFVRHMSTRPLRAAPLAQRFAADFDNWQYRRIAHDIYCEMFIQGYQQITELPVSADTGLALVLFVVFIFTFDQEFERRCRIGSTIDYPDILDTPVVAQAWHALARYLDVFGCADTILEHISRAFAENYGEYCWWFNEAKNTASIESTVKLVEYDSGRAMQTVCDMIRLFNDHQPDPRCAQQFFAVGMAGKFFDDFRDVAEDADGGMPNLLYAYASAHRETRAELDRALQNRVRVTLRWFSRHDPEVLGLYLDRAFGYYDRVRSDKLRFTLDICLALLGSRPRHRSPDEVAQPSSGQ